MSQFGKTSLPQNGGDYDIGKIHFYFRWCVPERSKSRPRWEYCNSSSTILSMPPTCFFPDHVDLQMELGPVYYSFKVLNISLEEREMYNAQLKNYSSCIVVSSHTVTVLLQSNFELLLLKYSQNYLNSKPTKQQFFHRNHNMYE